MSADAIFIAMIAFFCLFSVAMGCIIMRPSWFARMGRRRSVKAKCADDVPSDVSALERFAQVDVVAAASAIAAMAAATAFKDSSS